MLKKITCMAHLDVYEATNSGLDFYPSGNPLLDPLNMAPLSCGVKILTFSFVDGFSCMIAHFVRIFMRKTTMQEKINKKYFLSPKRGENDKNGVFLRYMS